LVKKVSHVLVAAYSAGKEIEEDTQKVFPVHIEFSFYGSAGT
jgi:hypothetical protein